jgi:hypothetical protein
MSIRVFNYYGDQLFVSPNIQSTLETITSKAGKSHETWDELTHEMLHVLEGDGFDIAKLQPQISYFETKKGKEIMHIDFFYHN